MAIGILIAYAFICLVVLVFWSTQNETSNLTSQIQNGERYLHHRQFSGGGSQKIRKSARKWLQDDTRIALTQSKRPISASLLAGLILHASGTAALFLLQKDRGLADFDSYFEIYKSTACLLYTSPSPRD